MADLDDHNNTRVTFYKSVPLLTNGVLDTFMVPLLQAKTQITELNQKSDDLIKEAILERSKVQGYLKRDVIKDFTFKFQFYRNKLSATKNKMIDLNQKVTLINERMKKIRQHQEYEAKRKSLLREKEEQLIGKSPATPT